MQAVVIFNFKNKNRTLRSCCNFVFFNNTSRDESRRSLVSLMMHHLRRYDVFRFAQNDVAPLRSASDAMFAPMCRQAHIIRRSRHHSAKPTSFAAGKHHSKNAPLSVDKSAFFVGLPDRIRTCDLKSRSLARYPAVPRADVYSIILPNFTPEVNS